VDIVTRKEAKARGLKRYFTSKLCKNGHVDQRHIHNGVCMGCIRVAGKNWYKKRREHKLEKSKQVYQKNRENVIARTDAYRRNNLDRYRVWAKNWAKKNPERAYQFSRNWTKKHPEKIYQYNRNQRAKRKLAVGDHTHKDILLRLDWQRGCCAACGDALANKYHVDHYIPLSRGGHNNPSNIQILCSSCNQRKHAKDPIVFYQEMGFLL
jgi:5-methylcytosine-specific restriction endonuclease McrA